MAEGVLEAVEHVVEGLGQASNLVRAVDVLEPLREVPRVNRRGEPRHPPQRAGHEARYPEADRDRGEQGERADDQERAAKTRLSLVDRVERIGDAEGAEVAAPCLDPVAVHTQDPASSLDTVLRPAGASSSVEVPTSWTSSPALSLAPPFSLRSTSCWTTSRWCGNRAVQTSTTKNRDSGW